MIPACAGDRLFPKTGVYPRLRKGMLSGSPSSYQNKMPTRTDVDIVSPASVSPEYQGLERQHQGLKPQDYRMHEREGVDGVEHKCPYPAGIGCDNHVMIVGICVRDAAAAWSYPIEASFEERLERHDERARPSDLLRVEQLLAALTKT